ncbi:MAG: hypothetical protein UH241_09910 [Acutalibacteraceae bacterium]|nr:hypothetical protein [Acutalibacteraceae bacterium]
MKKSKKIILVSVSILLVAVICFFVCTNFVFPVSFNVSEITYYRLDNNSDKGTEYDDGLDENDYFDTLVAEFADYRKSGYTDQQFLTEYTYLPSDNPSDYINISYHVKANNISLFDITNGIVLFDDINNETKFFLYTDIPLYLSVDKLSNSDWLFSCTAYVGDLSDKEVETKLKNVELQISYYSSIAKNLQTNIKPSDKVGVSIKK